MSFTVDYSLLDKLVHRIAFGGLGMQKILAEIEGTMFSTTIAKHEIEQPIFITSLPRAGTTLILDVIVRTGHFATHTYREMPFLLCPLLWSRLSKPFHKQSIARARAHGDGMNVDFDSPEAFEEILWRAFWSEHYKNDRIQPWLQDEQDVHEEFEPFFRNHIRKLIALRQMESGGTVSRYISKNNGNIAKIEKITSMFTDALVIVPFRAPVDHVGSLMQQHQSFLKMQSENPFVRRYMQDIGHYDFGVDLRPIDLDCWLGTTMYSDPSDVNFWLSYWVAVFEHVLDRLSDRVMLLSYDNLCAAPEENLEKLAAILQIVDEKQLVSQAGRFRQPNQYQRNIADASASLVERANDLFQRLSNCAAI